MASNFELRKVNLIDISVKFRDDIQDTKSDFHVLVETFS